MFKRVPRVLIAYQHTGCAEGPSPFAGSLRVSLRYNSFSLPFREETLARR